MSFVNLINPETSILDSIQASNNGCSLIWKQLIKDEAEPIDLVSIYIRLCSHVISAPSSAYWWLFNSYFLQLCIFFFFWKILYFLQYQCVTDPSRGVWSLILLRNGAGPWQVMLKQADGSFACIAESTTRFTLGEVYIFFKLQAPFLFVVVRNNWICFYTYYLDSSRLKKSFWGCWDCKRKKAAH